MVKSLTSGKRETNVNNYKSKHRAFRKGNRKVPQKLFHIHCCLGGRSGVEDWDFVVFEQCETHA